MAWHSLKVRIFVFANRHFGDDAGSSSVEFALLAPAFFGVVFSIFYAGWTALDMNTVHFAVVDAGRAVQLNPGITQSDVQKLISDQVSSLTGGSNVTVTLTKGAIVNGTQLTTAVANYPLTFTIPLIGTYTYNYSTGVTVVVYAS